MRSRMLRMFVAMAFVAMWTVNVFAQVQFYGPQPGDVYREYSRVMQPNDGEFWRVTDPNVNTTTYPAAAAFLPNPTILIPVSDLAGATRAEATITMWGGHISTYGKKVRFNGNAWINLPELDTTNGIPAGHEGFNYIYQSMVTVPVPLSNLVEGTNAFEGTNAGQMSGPVGYGFGWGQHGWYGMMIRVYYSSGKTHATGQITSPAQGGTMNDNPTITLSTSGSVDRVDVLAYYNGYDTDGDGKYAEYHHDYHLLNTDTQMGIRNHVGTVTSSPFSVVWDTKWVPDQAAGSVKLLARIRNTDGVWYVSPEVTSLSLTRTGKSVRIYKPLDTPERAWARGDLDPARIHVNIPDGTNLSDATDAVYHHRSWNGLDNVREPGESHYRRLNSWDDPDEYGGNHYFSYDLRSVPTSQLRTGSNEFAFWSQTVAHHGMEVLWPGPALQVEYTGSYASPVPATTVLFAPANTATGQPVTLTLNWLPAAAATAYEVQVSADSTFGSIAVSLTNVTGTTAEVGPLSNLTRYFWRVRGKNAAGTGPYSSYRAFNTFLASPTLTSPPNTATNVATTVPFVWRSLSAATSYRLQVSLNAGFTAGNIVRDTTLSDTTKTVSGLQYSTPYYWHVAGQTGGVWGDYSSAWTFTTAVVPAGVPTQLVPANNAVDQPLGLTIRWRSATAASLYHLQMGTDSTFGSGLLVNDSTLTDTIRTVSGLAYNQRYHWRVRSKNGSGPSAFSTIWHFRTVMSVPTGPALLLPPLASIEQPTTGILFTWRPLTGATFYTLQLATDSTFASGIVKNDTTITDTTRFIAGLAPSTRYFWRAAGRNAGGPGPFSATWNFTTYMPVPGMVTLVSPENLVVVRQDSMRFVWNKPTPPASRYWFELSLDSEFKGFNLIDSSLTDTTRFFRPMVDNTTYFWRVRGGTPTQWGPFSPERQITKIVTSVGEESEIPGEITLRQNYPNPFNPATEITFGVPKESHVRIE
ncbi:MAG TPA: fibronectin type III domain-containing protein, partial [Bacteroidota bacterium]|nr:fibronectin type III domain-containing protein [Bacteroidota bacterium]